MDIRNHIQTLVNGNSHNIYQEIKNEVDTVNLFFADNEEIQNKLPPQTQFSLKNMVSYLKKAEGIATKMDSYTNKIDAIEAKPDIRKMLDLEKEIEKSHDPREFGRMKRDLSALKTRFSSDLSKIASLKQQLIIHRLNIIQVWKSLLVCEIHIMEEGQKAMLNRIREGMEESDDPEFRALMAEKLMEVKIGQEQFQEIKIDTSALHTANVDKLKKTLVNQLDNVVKIENHLSQKKQEFTELSQVFNELKDKLPPEPQQAKKTGEMLSQIAAQTNGRTEQEKQAHQAKYSKMAYQEKARN
ncbi:hypothetical protein GF373_07555 [bacterium]|nr:hypothetical protein [bacterium]